MSVESYQKPGDFQLEICLLRSFNPDLKNVKELSIAAFVDSIVITESIYSNNVTCDVQMTDGHDLHQYFPIIGEEEFQIRWRTENDVEPVEYTFQVYNVSNKTKTNEGSYSYTLNCCKPEFIKSMSTRISKSFKQKTIGNIVSDIYEGYIKTNKDVVISDSSVELHNIVLPYWRPFACIDYMCALAHSSKTKSSTYLFFEDKDFYRFESLEELMEQSSYTYGEPYRVNPQSISSDNDPSRETTNYGRTIESYSFSNCSPDVIKEIDYGSRNSRTLSIDPFSKTSKIYDFDIKENFDQITRIQNASAGASDSEKGVFISQGIGNRFATPYSRYNIVYTKTHRLDSPYVNSKNHNDFSAKQEETLPWRKSIMTQYETINARIIIPGDTNITCGIIIDCEFPNLTQVQDKRNTHADKFLSGRYLIKSVTHVLSGMSSYKQTLELCKDSFGAPLSYDL